MVGAAPATLRGLTSRSMLLASSMLTIMSMSRNCLLSYMLVKSRSSHWMGVLPKDSALLVTSPRRGRAAPAKASNMNRNSFQPPLRPSNLLGLPMVRGSTALTAGNEECVLSGSGSRICGNSCFGSAVDLGDALPGRCPAGNASELLGALGLGFELAHDLCVAHLELLQSVYHHIHRDGPQDCGACRGEPVDQPVDRGVHAGEAVAQPVERGGCQGEPVARGKELNVVFGDGLPTRAFLAKSRANRASLPFESARLSQSEPPRRSVAQIGLFGQTAAHDNK